MNFPSMTLRMVTGVLGAIVMMFATGCSEETSDPPSSTARIVDTRMQGDWMECDENWGYRFNGIRIVPSGRLHWLGIDWETGNACVLDDPPFGTYVEIEARDGRLVYKQINRSNDTLLYSFSDDRMEWLRVENVPFKRFRRVEADQHLFDPVASTLSAEIDGSPFVAAKKLPYFPAWARVETRANTYDINIACTDRWSMEFVILGAFGPGTYPLATQGKSWARITRTEGDILQGGSTSQEIGGTITIMTFDRTNKRITGTFAFDALAYGGKDTIVVRNGIFDLPIRD
jgi:hypothetical protein